MKAKIYRGTKEIGGTCIELTADNGKILWIDLGTPLDEKTPNVDYARNKLDALLISHPHQDHFGLMEKTGAEVPVYIGQLSLDLINATKIFLDNPQLNRNFVIIKPWKSFSIADTFQIKPLLTDHSTPEAFAFLIEADGKRVFYSGDFRATGRKNMVFKKLIDKPPENIDLLLMEGTMVDRTNHLYSNEDDIEQAIYKIIIEQENLSFVISSAQNIDRFVSVFRACRKAHKYLVIDIYTAWILEMVRKQSENVPAIEWEEIKVYEHPGQLEKIKDKFFDEFRNRIQQQSIENSVYNPADLVYFVRCPNEKLVNKLRSRGIINIIYSQWEGYLLEDHKTYCTDYINKLKNDDGFLFKTIHTSGHATMPDLMKFAKAINPKIIVPIHTAYPGIFKKKFEKEGFNNIDLWDDGKEYQLNLKQNIMTKDNLKYFKIAKELNEKHHDELILKKLHFRGNIHSFSLISISPEFPEIGEPGLTTFKKGEEILYTISLEKPKRPTPEKKLQAWIIDYALNNRLKLPFGNYTFLTSEIAYPTPERKKGYIKNDILAIDNNNTLIIIELKSMRTNEVKKQAREFENEVIKKDEIFFNDLIELLLDRKWNRDIKKVAVWPINKGNVRKQEYLDVEEVNYELLNDSASYTFK